MKTLIYADDIVICDTGKKLIEKTIRMGRCLKTGVFNLLSSRANLNLSYNPAGRVIADYKIIMDILNIIIGARAARQVT